MKIIKVISGGQTGADQAGLFAATDMGIPTGGTAPNGWRTQKGPAPWLADYGVVEHTSHAYQPRTRCNVQASSVTLVFGNPNSPGCRLTRNYCADLDKPCFKIQKFDQTELDNIVYHLRQVDKLVINVAGNREESSPGIQLRTETFLKALFSQLK